MQCKVGSRWAPGGFRCCTMWFGVGVGSEVGWAASCRDTHQKKSGARGTTLNGSAELGDCAPWTAQSCCAHSNTYREETGSYHLASFVHHGNPCLRKARCHLLPSSKNWLLWMTPEWGSKSDPKIGFADRASPVRKSVFFLPRVPLPAHRRRSRSKT